MAGPVLQKILYVEDDPDIQEIAKLALVDVGGFSVHICSYGREAVQLTPQFKPDLIILDVMMPDIDGLTLIYKIRCATESANVPIIVFSAIATTSDRQVDKCRRQCVPGKTLLITRVERNHPPAASFL